MDPTAGRNINVTNSEVDKTTITVRGLLLTIVQVYPAKIGDKNAAIVVNAEAIPPEHIMKSLCIVLFECLVLVLL